MATKIPIDKARKNTRIAFYEGNILFIDNEGNAHIFRSAHIPKKKTTIKKTANIIPSITKELIERGTNMISSVTGELTERETNTVTKEITKCPIDVPCVRVFGGEFEGEDGILYGMVNTPHSDFAKKNRLNTCNFVYDDHTLLFVLMPDHSLHSAIIENGQHSFEFDDEAIPLELVGVNVDFIHHIRSEAGNGVIAIDEDRNMHRIGDFPECIDEFFEGDNEVSMICVDRMDDDESFWVGLDKNNRLIRSSEDLVATDDEEYRDFFVTMGYIKDVVDFDIYKTLGAAVNSEGKIQLWGNYYMVEEYEKIIPEEFLAK